MMGYVMRGEGAVFLGEQHVLSVCHIPPPSSHRHYSCYSTCMQRVPGVAVVFCLLMLRAHPFLGAMLQYAL